MPRAKRQFVGGITYQGRFKSFPVQSNEHYLTVLRYIESNPLGAKIVKNSRDWEYSSLAVRNGADKEGLKISAGPVKLPERWKRLVNVLPEETLMSNWKIAASPVRVRSPRQARDRQGRLFGDAILTDWGVARCRVPAGRYEGVRSAVEIELA